MAKYSGLDLSGRRLSLSRLPTTMLPETLRTIQGNRASVLDAADLSNAAPRHADGGSPIQVFTIPEGLLSTASSRLLPKGIRADLYVVINNALFIGFHVASIDRAVP